MGVDYKLLFSSVLGFSLALAWNNAVSRSIDYYYPPEGEVVQYFVYAIVITFIVIIMISIINRVQTQQSAIGNGQMNQLTRHTAELPKGIVSL